MFDIERIVDAVTSVAGSSAAPAEVLMQQLAELGIDADSLQGLDAGQITDLLEQHGIDVAGLELGELSGVMEQLGNSETLASGIGQWLSGHLGRS